MAGSLQMMLSTASAQAGVVVDGDSWSVEVEGLNPTAGFRLETDGTTPIVKVGATIVNTLANWFSPTTASIGNSYWVEATLSSGDSPSGSLGTRLALSTGRQWSVGKGQTCVIALSFFNVSSGGSAVGSASVSLTGTGTA